jgi:phosphatidylglycerophosphatase A
VARGCARSVAAARERGLMSGDNVESKPTAISRFAVWLATGFGVGRWFPAPGTAGAAMGVPLAWALGHLPNLGVQTLAVVLLNVIGVPLATSAGRSLGGEKDNQAIIWDEIASVPIVFLFAPLTHWWIGLVGFGLHRLFDISKFPPARQLERLPDGLGVMADDWVASVYAGLVLAAVVYFLGRMSPVFGSG